MLLSSVLIAICRGTPDSDSGGRGGSGTYSSDLTAHDPRRASMSLQVPPGPTQSQAPQATGVTPLRTLNPFVFDLDRSATPNTRRWSHVFARLADTQYAYRCVGFVVFNVSHIQSAFSTTWKSLVHPACLPLTTDFFPNPAILASDYEESNYSVVSEGNEYAGKVSFLAFERI